MAKIDRTCVFSSNSWFGIPVPPPPPTPAETPLKTVNCFWDVGKRPLHAGSPPPRPPKWPFFERISPNFFCSVLAGKQTKKKSDVLTKFEDDYKIFWNPVGTAYLKKKLKLLTFGIFRFFKKNAFFDFPIFPNFDDFFKKSAFLGLNWENLHNRILAA